MHSRTAWLAFVLPVYLLAACQTGIDGSSTDPVQSSSLTQPSSTSSADNSRVADAQPINPTHKNGLIGTWVLRRVQIGGHPPRLALPGRTILSFDGRILHTYGACGQQTQAQATVDATTVRLTKVVSASAGAPPPGSQCGDSEAVGFWNTYKILHWEVGRSNLVVSDGSTTVTYKAG